MYETSIGFSKRCKYLFGQGFEIPYCNFVILFMRVEVDLKTTLVTSLRQYALQRWSRGHKALGQGQEHKNNPSQGQPFRGQTLSRLRTGMLEAKAKDQGHKRKCSPKK